MSGREFEPLFALINSELENYRRTGRLLHFLHAARAVEELKARSPNFPSKPH